MLIGTGTTPQWPFQPAEYEGVDGIFRYIRELEKALNVAFSTLTTNTVGIAGIRGLSGTGSLPQNFTKGPLSISNTTQAMWVFTNLEANTTYMILYSLSAPASAPLIGVTKGISYVLFNLGAIAPSGVSIDALLVR